jgi:hypothetical protein
VNGYRRLAVVAGICFLLADAAGGLFFAFTGGLGTGRAYLDAVPTHQAEVGLGALCVFLMGAFGLGIVAAFYPVLRTRNEGLAIGAFGFRAVAEGLAFLEAALTLATISVAKAAAGAADAGQSLLLSNALLDLRDQLGLVAPTAFGIAALLYCHALLRYGLLPRWLAGWGFLGAIVWLAGTGWGFVVGGDGGLAMAPLALNEIVMALWLIGRGFSAPQPALAAAPVSAFAAA